MSARPEKRLRVPSYPFREDSWQMHLENLFDGTSAAIVVGGTALATLLRCGVHDCAVALGALHGALRRRFSADLARAELAVYIQDMQRDGVIRAAPIHLGDAEVDAATDALIGTRSLAGLEQAHQAGKRRRADVSVRAVRTFTQAADLAPVFGLAGTLVSLSQLSTGPGLAQDFAPAIAMAVLTTLYGLLLGNIVLAPLGRMVARLAAHEEAERQKLLEWLEEQVASALPGAGRAAAPAPSAAASAGPRGAPSPGAIRP